MSFLSSPFGKKDAAPNRNDAAALEIARIAQPTIGFMNLMAEKGRQLVELDGTLLAPLFASTRCTEGDVPNCDVLFLYGDIDGKGCIAGTAMRLRDILKTSGARLAVVASGNNSDHCFAAVEPENGWSANIVLAVDRKGASFGKFFHSLFKSMFKGESILLAWVELAPQIPGHVHPDCPNSILLPEAGHIAFDMGESRQVAV